MGHEELKRVGVGDLFTVDVPAGWDVQPTRERPGFEAEPDDATHFAVSVSPRPAVDLAPIDILTSGLDGSLRDKRSFTHDSGFEAAQITVRGPGGLLARTCAVVSEDVAVLLTLSAPRDDSGASDCFAAIVTSLTFGESPERRRLRLVAESLQRRWPEASRRLAAVDLIEVEFSDGIAKIGLTSLIKRIEAEPEREDELVDQFVASLPGPPSESGGDETPELDTLFPRLVPVEKFEGLEPPDGFTGPALRDFPGQLKLGIVSSVEWGDRYITGDDLVSLRLSFDDALERAKQNLDTLLGKTPLQASKAPDGRVMLVLLTGHTHAAAALALPSFSGRLQELLGEAFLVCVPALDELVAFRDDPAIAEKVIPQARDSFSKDPYPVTDSVFRPGPDGMLPDDEL